MTIYRQLALLFVGLMLTVFAGTMISTIQNTRTYLQAQLHSHAQDAASSLGISVSPYMTTGQIPAIVSTAEAMFDGGYYRRIAVTDMQGNILVERSADVTLEGVPAWFVRALTLETPETEAVIMDGWNQAGIIRVSSHPGYAYRQLWQSLVGNARWFGIGALVAILAGILLLRLTLKPLSAVERQAEAICERRFQTLDNQPRTRELASIVAAMNKLSGTVERMLRESEGAIENFRAMAYQSPVTGLPNRRRFMDILNEKLASKEQCSWALLCLVELTDFKNFNNRHGFVKGDRLLREAGLSLQSALAADAKTNIAHLGGATFIVLSEERIDAETLGHRLLEALHLLRENGFTDSRDIGNVGITAYDGSQNSTELLSDADTALRSAQATGTNSWHFYSSSAEDRPSRTASEWREYIRAALGEGRLRLLFQSAVRIPDRSELHREALVRIAETAADGTETLVPAGMFIPMAANLELTAEIDRAVISRAIDHLVRGHGDHVVAVNLSVASIRQAEFVSWVDHALGQNPDAASRLCFEISDYGADSGLAATRDFLEMLARRGGRFGLDDVGADIGVISCLRSFRADYVKIDGSFIRDLETNGDQQFFVRTLSSIAHSLDLDIIAKSVETQAAWDLLASMEVDGAQGYFIERPAPEQAA